MNIHSQVGCHTPSANMTKTFSKHMANKTKLRNEMRNWKVMTSEQVTKIGEALMANRGLASTPKKVDHSDLLNKSIMDNNCVISISNGKPIFGYPMYHRSEFWAAELQFRKNSNLILLDLELTSQIAHNNLMRLDENSEHVLFEYLNKISNIEFQGRSTSLTQVL